MRLKLKNAIIVGERIYLRELNIDDATIEYCDWLNNPEVNKYLETREITVPELQMYIQKQIDDSKSFFAGIFDNKNNFHIGNIKLEPIDFETKRAIFGLLIGEKSYWGKGIATEATKLIVKYAFEQLSLEEIELGVILDNKAAIRVYEKVGFKIIEVKEKSSNHNGILYDGVIMVIKK